MAKKSNPSEEVFEDLESKKQLITDAKAFFDQKHFDRRYDEPFIKSMGSYVRVRSLTDAEYTQVQSVAMKPDGTMDKDLASTFNARLVRECLVNSKGNLYLSENDVKRMRKMDASIMDELAKVCRDFVGCRDAEEVKN